MKQRKNAKRNPEVPVPSERDLHDLQAAQNLKGNKDQIYYSQW